MKGKMYPNFMYPKGCPAGVYYAGKGLPSWLKVYKPLYNFVFETVALIGYWQATVRRYIK